MRRGSPQLKCWGLVAVFSLVLLSLDIAQAAKVLGVKGSTVLLDIDGLEVSKGDKVYALIGGKRKAVIEITQVSGAKAKGKVTKGKTETDAEIQLASGGGSSGEASNSKRSRNRPGLFVGALIGYSFDSQTVKDANDVSTSMSGGGFSLLGFGDLPVMGPLGVIARVGIDQFEVTGKDSAATYKTSIMYASADLLVRYNFMEGNFTPFAAGGFGLHFPVSKSSDILDVPRISSTTIFFFSGGATYSLTPEINITGSLEYGLFPPSNQVTTNWISARGGLAWRW